MELVRRPAIGAKPFQLTAIPTLSALGAAVVVLVAALVCLPLITGGDSYTLHLLMSVFIFATLGHAWNLMAGFGGMLSFGQQVFIGLAGFSEAFLCYYAAAPLALVWLMAGLVPLGFALVLTLPSRPSRRGSVSPLPLVLGALAIVYEILATFQPGMDIFGDVFTRRACLLLIVFLGALPLLRLRGPHFAIATWLIAESVATIFNGWPLAGAGGGMQINVSVSPTLLYYLSLCLVVVVSLGIWFWVGSTHGLALTAVRDDEEAAESCGVDVTRIKQTIFLVSALITGLAAGLSFMDTMIITPVSGFSISWSSYVVFVVVAGGMGTVAGPLIGALAFVIIERVLGQMSGQGQLVLGVISIVLMLFLPRGIVGLLPAARRKSATAVRTQVDPG